MDSVYVSVKGLGESRVSFSEVSTFGLWYLDTEIDGEFYWWCVADREVVDLRM